MSRIISGSIVCRIDFNSLVLEDGQSALDAIFPDGFEGEMLSQSIDLSEDRDEEDEAKEV